MSITTLIRRHLGHVRELRALSGAAHAWWSGPLELPAARAAGVSAGILALLALAGASVRVLPWLLDPRVPWRMALPFGRAVASVAVEAAVLVGWPVGWALAAFVLIERGEARVLAMLGERPLRTTLRLVPMALFFGALVGGAALAGGRDASEPGRVLGDLLRAGRASCGSGGASATSAASAASEASVASAAAVEVPLLGAEWLCAGKGGGAAHLVGHPPFSRARESNSVYSARAIDVSPDARRIELEDAFVVTGATTLHVKHALFRLPPFVRASSLPAPWRGVVLALSGAASGLVAVWLLLAMDQRALTLWRIHALVLGAAGPVTALAFLHALERAEAPMPLRFYATLPVVAAAATLSVALVVSRLPGVRVAASK